MFDRVLIMALIFERKIILCLSGKFILSSINLWIYILENTSTLTFSYTDLFIFQVGYKIEQSVYV